MHCGLCSDKESLQPKLNFELLIILRAKKEDK